jgi:hypothetical protein
MDRPAQADETRARLPGAALGVMRRAKNTPTDALTVLNTMRLLQVLLAAALCALGSTAGAVCNDAAGCPYPLPTVTASVESATPPAQVAQLPGEGVTALAPADSATAPARVAATMADGRPAGALVMRPEAVRAGARAAAEPSRAEPRSAGGPETSSVWLMLFAGFAFAGFVIAKRSRS